MAPLVADDMRGMPSLPALVKHLAVLSVTTSLSCFKSQMPS